ncbi:hypothetical protein L0244_16910 [bacterium]|nr:hypothetical protein [bacterium]
MYPKIFGEYFREFERTPEVFVAMPFSSEFEKHWKNIFKPAISSLNLKPYRVNMSRISDSILIDILRGVGRAKFVVVDISGQMNGSPNPNVMYELGLAHAFRLPEEVIVVRASSDEENTPFDIKHIRWHSFNQNNIKRSKSLIIRLLKESQREIDLTRDIILERVLTRLDPDMITFLNSVRKVDYFDLALFDEDRKGLYSLGYRDSSESEIKRIARALINRGILATGEDALNYGIGIYGASSFYEISPLDRALLKRLPNPPKIKPGKAGMQMLIKRALAHQAKKEKSKSSK